MRARRAAHLAVATRKKRLEAWGWFLTFLACTGGLEPTAPMASRLTFERLGPFIMSMRDRLRAGTIQIRLRELAQTAGHLDARAGLELGLFVTRRGSAEGGADVPQAHRGARSGSAAPRRPRSVRRCRAALAGPASSVRFRDGLLIAVAVVYALRSRNLAEMEIGEHLLIEGSQMRIVLDLKNWEIIDSPVFDFLLPFFRRYLECHRPTILGPGAPTSALWVNREQRPLDVDALGGVFERNGQRMIGQPVKPHSVRHALASDIMRSDPRRFTTCRQPWGTGARGRQSGSTTAPAARQRTSFGWHCFGKSGRAKLRGRRPSSC